MRDTQEFLTEVDEETRLDNEQQIAEWERDLRDNEAMADWRDHDISKKIATQAKVTYKELSMQLATNRSLTDEQRRSFWGRQDACLFILSLTEMDAKGALERIHAAIRAAIAAG